MGDVQLNLNEPPNEGNFVAGFECYTMLMKDRKPICRTRCLNPPFQMPPSCNISEPVRPKPDDFVSALPQCILLPAYENSQQLKEWGRFLGFLQEHKKIAIAKVGSYEFCISPPNEGPNFSHAVVSYRMGKTHMYDGQKHDLLGMTAPATLSKPTKLVTDAHPSCGILRPGCKAANVAEEFICSPDACITGRSSAAIADKCSDRKFLETIEDLQARESRNGTCSRAEAGVLRQNGLLEKNYVQAHPSYLKTLGQAHSSWIFGAMAELVDNSRDAKATKLEISIDMVFSKTAGRDIPMLSFIDDGHGMTHQEIVRMISFGHKQPDADDPDHVGRFGIGFKTGAMRLGKDALVLTQTANSRSIAFLSQSLNEGKDNLEIPIVSYQRQGNFMEVDTCVQTEALAKYNLKAIKEFSPFNKYLIGEKASLFHEKVAGTQIYIWNLDKWGTDYCLEWQTGRSGGSSFHQGDILIRSERIRSRPGQTSRMVPLDYSLQSYLEVIFLDPRMKIYVQGSLVRSRPLAKSLNSTVVENSSIMGKPVQLILGRYQLEWEQANCGIFLYWHGRLVEAYKRVGGMIHSADTGRGVIGVIDVTDLMNDGNGQVWVHSNKQGFQDCELYARLEEWLGSRFDKYWDNKFDTLQLKKNSGRYKPDHEWVQCDKCRKWRILSSGFDSRQLPEEWFCYMNPFYGKCEMPEQKVERGVVTVSAKRSGYDLKQNPVDCQDALLVKPSAMSKGSNDDDDDDDDDSSQTVEEDVQAPSLKRLRRGPRRFCKRT